MDTNLWQKLARMAKRGDRVVVVEDGEGFVVLPLDEYERLNRGEASLQLISSEQVKKPLVDEKMEDDIFEDDLSDILDIHGAPPELPELDEKPVQNLASVEEFEEERFYLEPVE